MSITKKLLGGWHSLGWDGTKLCFLFFLIVNFVDGRSGKRFSQMAEEGSFFQERKNLI